MKINNIEQILTKDNLYYCTKVVEYKELKQHNILPILSKKDNISTTWVYIRSPDIDKILRKVVN